MTEWDRTCEVLALLMNIHRDPKKMPEIESAQLNPYRKRVKAKQAPQQKRKPRKDAIDVMTRIFVDGNQRKRKKKR